MLKKQRIVSRKYTGVFNFSVTVCPNKMPEHIVFIRSFKLSDHTVSIFTMFSDTLLELISSYATGSYFKINWMIIQDLIFPSHVNY